MLTSRLGSFEDLNVLDLFAGSGALGLEALSRGAGQVTFVEQDGPALDCLRKNIDTLGAGDRAVVKAGSALALGIPTKPFDLVMMDPPYGTGAGAVALDKLGRLGWFAPHAWISIETAKNEEIALPGYTLDVRRDHGKARLHLFRVDGDA
jgi:16S rRNA (guanine966-N2)-methyltransferase